MFPQEYVGSSVSDGPDNFFYGSGQGREFGVRNFRRVDVEAFHADVGIGHLHGVGGYVVEAARVHLATPLAVGVGHVVATGGEHVVARFLHFGRHSYIAEEVDEDGRDTPGMGGEGPDYPCRATVGGGFRTEDCAGWMEEQVGGERQELVVAEGAGEPRGRESGVAGAGEVDEHLLRVKS